MARSLTLTKIRTNYTISYGIGQLVKGVVGPDNHCGVAVLYLFPKGSDRISNCSAE